MLSRLPARLLEAIRQQHRRIDVRHTAAQYKLEHTSDSPPVPYAPCSSDSEYSDCSEQYLPTPNSADQHQDLEDGRIKEPSRASGWWDDGLKCLLMLTGLKKHTDPTTETLTDCAFVFSYAS